MGAIRMILDFTHLEPRCGEEDTRPSIIAKVHYMYFALILFWITVITIVVVSLFTKPMEGANVSDAAVFAVMTSANGWCTMQGNVQQQQRIGKCEKRINFIVFLNICLPDSNSFTSLFSLQNSLIIHEPNSLSKHR